MAYIPHSYLTFGGTLKEVNADDEIWQCGMRLDRMAAGDLHTYLTEIQAAMKTWFTSANAQHFNTASLKWLKVVQIEADGLYPAGFVPEVYDYASPGAGSVSAGGAPSFCSLVLSWSGTDYLRGPASRGRIYPPNYGLTLTAGSGVANLSSQTSMVTAAKALLTAVNNLGGTVHTAPILTSKVLARQQLITGVRIGNVIDTQRRRRNKIAETYLSSVWP